MATPRRSFRCETALWRDFQASCSAIGQTATGVILKLMREWTYGEKHKPEVE